MDKKEFLNKILDKLLYTFDLILERGEDPDYIEKFYDYLEDVRVVIDNASF